MPVGRGPRAGTFAGSAVMNMSEQSCSEHDAHVVQLIASSQRGLFLYICGLLFSRQLAEDVLQETNLVLWEKRAEYRPNGNFYAWACQIAFYKVCKARDEQRRKVPAFTDVFLRHMAPELQAVGEASNQLQDYLQECIKTLVDRDRSLLERRYDDNATTKSIASQLGQSVRQVNRSLARIHESLFDCIHAKLSEERKA
jgi:RNA polymerase sigma-70 factor, ECF subfamily